MKKTLGGPRLGSGNKMEVDMHNYSRSTHDKSRTFRTTMAAGTLVPCFVDIALPGDTWDFKIGMEGNTHPALGPLFGSFKAQIDVFLAPMRLYQGQLHNNKLGIGLNMAAIKFPFMRLAAKPTPQASTPDIDNAQINPSCILSYLGIRGVGVNEVGGIAYRDFNANPYLMYVDTYKNYYANKQEEKGAVIHTTVPTLNPTVTSVYALRPGEAAPGIGISQAPTVSTPPPYLVHGTKVSFNTTAPSTSPDLLVLVRGDGKRIPIKEVLTNIVTTNILVEGIYDSTKFGIMGVKSWDYTSVTEAPGVVPTVQLFDLNHIDTMREKILAAVENPAPFNIQSPDLDPYALLLAPETTTPQPGFLPKLLTQEGLLIKTYQSDLFNNWLQTEWIDGAGGINEITAIDTSGGSFTIDTLNLSKKVYDMLNRIAVSGGTYDDWLDAVYTHDRITRAETPMYYGGLSKELVFQEIFSNAEATGDDGTQPLGTLAGKGGFSAKHKGGQVHIKVDEPSIIMAIVSLTPRLDYSQGNEWFTHLQSIDDLHKPALDEIGFQELITEQMAWWDTKAVGVQSGDMGIWIQKSAGKQPAWLNYMTAVNKTYGNFAIKSNEMFMTLNRQYEQKFTGAVSDGIKDLTTYIDPVKYNQIFAQKALDAQNFWIQIAFDVQARRKMSAKIMPNL